jgi:hypothetical protein
MAARRRDDFSEGRIVRLKGWIVADTESPAVCSRGALHASEELRLKDL